MLIAAKPTLDARAERLRADQDEESIGPQHLLADPARDGYGLEPVLAAAIGDLGVGTDADPPVAFDPLDEIARHAAPERVAPDQHRDLGCVVGEMQRRLARRVGSPHDHDSTARVAGGIADGLP